MEQFGPINQNTQYRSLLGSLAIQTAEKTTVDHPSNLARTKSKSDNNAIPESPTTQRLRLYQLQKGNSQSVIVSRPGALAREGSRSGHAHARTSSFEKGMLFSLRTKIIIMAVLFCDYESLYHANCRFSRVCKGNRRDHFAKNHRQSRIF